MMKEKDLSDVIGLNAWTQFYNFKTALSDVIGQNFNQNLSIS